MEYKLFDHYLPSEAIDIRYRVFTLEQGFKKEDDLDDIDKDSIHILVFIKNKAIATARMFKVDDSTFHIGRLAILKEYRHKRVGSFILSIFENVAKTKNVTVIELGSQIDKTLFYEKNGYTKYGDIFDDAGYPHILMKKLIQN